MRVLVLGGTGFIGGAVVRRLLEDGHAVAAFHRGETNPQAAGAETIRGDRAALISHRDTFHRFAPDAVVDTIAYTEADARGLVETFRGIAPRIVVLSSQDVYAAYGRLLRLERGSVDRSAATEDSPLRTSRHPYRGISKPGEMAYDYDKIPVEDIVRGRAGVPVTILRLPMVYGPGDRQRRLAPYVRRMAAGDTEIRIDRAKAAWRCTRGFVENVAAAIALAVTDPRAAGRVYNVGESDALTEAEWIRAVAVAAGWRGRVREIDREELPEGEREPYEFAHDLVADTSRIRRELGFDERVGRDEALRRSVEWEANHA
jgi:nucleoside-diphosphate-sugar epimerase